MNKNTTIKLNDGNEIPLLGFGTYQIKGSQALEATKYALKVGYRHIDTAQLYANENEVGQAISESGLKRDEVFVTSKLELSNFGHDQTIKAVNESLKKLALEYLDLFILHWPVEKYRIESYKALEELQKQGKLISIGVSNFTIKHLEELIEQTTVAPAVNQVEFSPYLYQKELLEYCVSKGIQLEAYSPLTQGNKLNDPKLKSIAENYDKSTAQLLIRWNLEHNIVVLPKSVKPTRIKENADVFDFKISEDDMALLDDFNQNLRFSWNPEDNRQVKTFSNSVVRKLSRLKKNF